MPSTTHHRRALTIIEVLVAIFFLLLIIAVLFPLLTTQRHHGSRQIKCGTQIRNVIQALTVFSQSNRDLYPLPSQLDANNDTVADAGRAKDRINNTLSILVWNSSISAELLYCPSETNSAITYFSAYQTAHPQTAVHPDKALWDPALRADFTSGTSHISYAMAMTDGDPSSARDKPAAGRLRRWMSTFSPTEAVFGNRGPLVTGRDAKGNILYNKSSNTMAIHGARTTWEGNIGYNDNHVNFESRMDPSDITYTVAGAGVKKQLKADIFFFDEPDDADGLNANLGVWIQAGNKPSEFKGIHD